MAVDVRALVVIEIDLGGAHDRVAAPVVGTWSDSRTSAGWELAARLTRREFGDLAESLRFVPANAAVDGHVATIPLAKSAWPGARAATLRFDADLLEPLG